MVEKLSEDEGGEGPLEDRDEPRPQPRHGPRHRPHGAVQEVVAPACLRHGRDQLRHAEGGGHGHHEGQAVGEEGARTQQGGGEPGDDEDRDPQHVARADAKEGGEAELAGELRSRLLALRGGQPSLTFREP